MLDSDLAHIRKVLEEARKGNLAQKMGDLLTFFQCRGYAHLQQISCKHVGCHEANRDGQMVDVTHVQDLLKSFATLGYAPESSLSGICIELGHDDGSNTTRKKNQELIEKSNGKLGGDTTTLKYASVSGSHRNQCMRSVVYRCLCDDPEVGVEGKWSLDRFDEAFQKACTSGTQWLVVSRDVLAAFPDWAALQQAASNATGQQQKVETELQALQKICSIVKKGLTNRECVKKALHLQEVLNQFVSLLEKEAGVKDWLLWKHVGHLGLEGVALVLDKKRMIHYGSIEEAAVDQLNNLCEEAGISHVTSPWVVKKEDAKTAKGFRDGCMIQRLDDTVAKIITVDKDGVTMLIECEKPYQAKASLQSFLDGEWKLKKTHAQELVPWTTACQPSVSKEFFFACVKAQVQMEMFEQLKMPKMKHFLGLEIYKGPRDVKVSRSFKSGELVIPCSTCKVVIAPEVKDALVIGQCSHGGDTFLVALAPLTQWPKEDDESGFLNPFWLLPESCEKDEASCEIQDIKL
ncbi:Uncharacterized protein SCF082_LOCUS45529, partial [Durusdinium trenchii]